jgi:hypothetical protein
MSIQFCKRVLFTFLFASFFAMAYGQKPGAYKCLEFDGTNDYVLVKDNSSLNSDSTITVEAWIKADAYGRNVFDNSIFCKHGWTRGNLGYVLRCGSNGKISFNMSDGSGNWKEAASASLMETGIWYHVAGSYDGDSLNVYINGDLVGTTLYTGSISPSTGLTARIGDLANGGGRLFDGMIDEVRVWSTGLDQATIREWMCRRINSNHPNFSNFEANWRLDEDSGTSAADASGTGNTGTLTNSPTISLSGAVIGDTSAYINSGTLVRLKSKYGDELIASDITNTPSCFYIVADYTPSEQNLDSGLSGQLDSTHYFSMFYPHDTSVDFTISYDFGDKKGVSNTSKCGIDLFKKAAGYTGTWEHAAAYYHQNGDSMSLGKQKFGEIGVISYPTDSNAIVSSNTGSFTMCGSDKIVLTAIGNDSFTYKWFLNDSQLYSVSGNELTVDSVANYRVEITRNSTSCTFKSSTISVSRISKPKVSLSSFSGVCESVDSVALAGGSPSGGFYSGTGVSGDYFLPSTVGQGNYTITYHFSDTNKCGNQATQNIQVYGLPSLTSNGPVEYCNDKDSVSLNAITPTGGTYTGRFISNNYFHIDSANRVSKKYPFRYEYTDGNGCSNTYDDSLEVKWATPCTLSALANLCSQDDSVELKGTPASGDFTGTGVSGNYFHPQIAGVGKHSVVYSFTNLLNCTTTDTQEVVVISNSRVTWTEKVTTCINGDTISLKEGSPNGGYFVGLGLSSSGSFDPRISGIGNHLLAYISIDSNGCHNKAYVTSIVHDTSEISFSGSTSVCLFSSPIALDIAKPAGGLYSGKGVVNDTMYPKVADHGTHKIEYTFINSDKCISSNVVAFEIFKPDSVSISAKDKFCSYDDPAVLKLYPSGGLLVGKGVIGSVFSPGISGPGSHTIRYTISGSKGCNAMDSIVMLVGEQPTVSISTLSNICENDDAFKLVNGLPLDSGLYRINGKLATHVNPSILGQGFFQIDYKVTTDLGCVDSASTNLTIYQNPQKPLITKIKNTLNSSFLNGNQWYNEAGMLAGDTNQAYEATESGRYWTIVTSNFGCETTSDTFDFMYVSVGQILPDWIKVSPNPSKSGIFHLMTTSHFDNYYVVNILGETIDIRPSELGSKTVDLSNYPSGIYSLVIRQGKSLYSIKLIKE